MFSSPWNNSCYTLLFVNLTILLYLITSMQNGTNWGYSYVSHKYTPSLYFANSSGIGSTNDWMNTRVLCAVLTQPLALESQTKFIRDTWGPRCDVTLYISDEKNSTFPTITVTKRTGHAWLWAKVRNTLELIYKSYSKKADWFFICEDDTYVVVPNLKKFLSRRSLQASEYYGKIFTPIVKGGYASGGAGYAMSRPVLEQLVKVGFKDTSKCPAESTSGKPADVTLAICLDNLGIEAKDATYDDFKDGDPTEQLFHWQTPENEFKMPWGIKGTAWLNEVSKLPPASNRKEAKSCCSKSKVVTFHSVKGPAMLFMDFLFNNFTTL